MTSEIFIKGEIMFHRRVVQRFTKLSETEQYICQQLVQIQNNAKRCGIVTLAKRCHTSTATLYRTIKSLGYDGYTEFKYDFFQKASEVVEKSETDIQSVWQAMHKTERLLKGIQYENVIENDKRTVYICGSGVIQRQAAEELERQLKGSHYIVERISDVYEWEKLEPQIQQGDIAVLISLSGENEQLVNMGTSFQLANAHVIAICLDGMNTLSKMASTVVPYKMPQHIESIVPLYMAVEYVVDLLRNHQ